MMNELSPFAGDALRLNLCVRNVPDFIGVAPGFEYLSNSLV
jgi:hypothetical protein